LWDWGRTNIYSWIQEEKEINYKYNMTTIRICSQKSKFFAKNPAKSVN